MKLRYHPTTAMEKVSQQFIQRVQDGSDRSISAHSIRLLTSLLSPAYAGVMRTRNLFYENSFFASHSLGRPTISVGNVTTGGTGKTPVVAWLAQQLRRAGRKPAILLRGYKSTAQGVSDEQQLLENSLTIPETEPVPVRADPNRLRGAAAVLHEHPETDTFLLDDAFQHRKVSRDFDLVLIDATQPFGFGHVLPRGLLREPMSALSRAHAFLITHQSQIAPDELQSIETRLAHYQPAAPILKCDHRTESIRLPTTGENLPISDLQRIRCYAISGIANPASFELQLKSCDCALVGHEWFPDHHSYTLQNMQRIQQHARAAGAEKIVMTEKDWVKIALLPAPSSNDISYAVTQLTIRFVNDDADRLLQILLKTLPPH